MTLGDPTVAADRHVVSSAGDVGDDPVVWARRRCQPDWPVSFGKDIVLLLCDEVDRWRTCARQWQTIAEERERQTGEALELAEVAARAVETYISGIPTGCAPAHDLPCDGCDCGLAAALDAYETGRRPQ